MAVTASSNAAWGGARKDLVAGWRSRELWGHLGWQDIRQRYRRSVLGPIWITISMAVTAIALGILYAGLFGNDLSVQLPYILVGFIVWALHQRLHHRGRRGLHRQRGPDQAPARRR